MHSLKRACAFLGYKSRKKTKSNQNTTAFHQETSKVLPPSLSGMTSINTLKPRINGRHFPDDIFKCIFLSENVWIPITISLKFVPKGPINYITALVQIMAWRRPGDKPLTEPMMVRFPTHICVTRPQWVNPLYAIGNILPIVYIQMSPLSHRDRNTHYLNPMVVYC